MKPAFFPVILGGARNSFTPARLFSSGAKGAWYDPSDYSSLCQDSAGATPVTAAEQPVGLMRDKSGNGNHASQATTASRPVLRARYNLLTYSEQFDNALWIRTGFDAFGSGSVANATTAPDGTTTADFIRPGTTSSAQKFTQNPSPAQTAQTLSIYVKASGYSKVALKESATTGNYASFDLSNGTVLANTAGVGTSIIALSNSWYRISMALASAGSCGLQISVLAPAYTTGDPNGSTFSGDGTSGVFVWGAMLNTGSSAGTYQRIAAATDYATAGFLPYLALDGTDDSFGTGSIDFSTTDKMFVCAGLTKNSDAATGTVIDQNGVAGTNTFMLRAPSSAAANYVFYSGGSTGFSGATATPYAAPITNVVSGIGNISGDQEIIRINGAQVAISTVDQGTGNYSNLPIYIGRRQGTGLPFNGRLYQMVVCGKTLSASELASTEAFVNQKTGAY